jgi:hypothetical protein
MRKSILFNFFTKIFIFTFLLVGFCIKMQAQVSGKVFRDFNANGIQTTAAPSPIEPGLKDVIVNAYDNTNTLFTATTNSTGNYTVVGGTGPYRVEFILPAFYYASNGSVSNTTVQFVAAGGTANLGVNYPADYCHTVNPRVYTTMFYNGDNQVSGSNSANGNSIITFNYDATGKVTNGRQGNTGAVWGTAYHRTSDKVFFAAFGKRHNNWGPLGPNGIYVTNTGQTANANTSTGSFINLNSINPAFNAGSVVRNFLPGSGDPYQANYDENMFNQVGKVGLGDIDISDDLHNLYVVNLNDRKLWQIAIGITGIAPTSASQINAYPNFPNPCTNSTFRPFAMEIYKGYVYVGGVCDGVSTNGSSVDRNNLKATIYKADLSLAPSAATWSLAFEMPLTFNRDANLNLGGGAQASDRYTDPNGTNNSLSISSWHPWARNEADVFLEYSGSYFYPQPMLTDLEFDIDGSLILGFADRMGHQGGYGNYTTNTSSGSSVYSTGIGDIMRVHNNNGTFELENNGTAGTITTAGAGNNDGPGGGEYYYQDRFECCGLGNTQGPTVNHDETSIGGLALLAGKNEVLNSTFDATDSWDSGGVRWYNNMNGEATNGLLIYGNNTPAFFGKASGIGDIELLCDAQPIEIGNRIFMDTNLDGIQNPSEMGIPSVRVELWKAGFFDSFTTTDGNGQYIFSNLLPNTAYELKILAANIPAGKSLTTKDAPSAGAVDVADSDASLVGSDAVIAYTTGTAGQNNHTLDFGFKIACNVTFTVSSTDVVCYGANDGTIILNITSGTPPYEYSIDDGLTFGASTPSTIKTYSNLVPSMYKPAVRDANGCVKKCQ